MDSSASIEMDLEPMLARARPDIRALTPYSHAQWDPALERLHANESPWRGSPDDSIPGLNRYPEPQPQALLGALAALYGVPDSRVLVGRGSDEAIDLLVRAFCAAGQDAVLVTPPTFDMYAVAARIQGANVVEVPLRASRGFALDADAVIAALSPAVKIVFLCSPNNPTGTSTPAADILRVVEAAAGRALVVLDEAYVEYAGVPSLAAQIDQHANLVVLRTLSKAHGLAGARIGTLIARPGIVALLRKIIPPYAIAQPTIEAALRALAAPQQAITQQRIALITAEREKLTRALRPMRGVHTVWPSNANFLLVEFAAPQRAFEALSRAGLLVRDQRRQPGLENALRITIGSPQQNARLLQALEQGL